MTRALIILPFALATIAGPTSAQVAPAPGQFTDPHRYQADQHRYEIDRLRAQADQREAFARRLELEARLNRFEVEAARAPDLSPQPACRPLCSPGEERALRESAARRRRATVDGVGQIDDWLDRAPD
jgi:hypothetical protein